MQNNKIVITNFIKQVFLMVFTLTHPRPPIQDNLPFYQPKTFIMLPYSFYFILGKESTPLLPHTLLQFIILHKREEYIFIPMKMKVSYLRRSKFHFKLNNEKFKKRTVA